MRRPGLIFLASVLMAWHAHAAVTLSTTPKSLPAGALVQVDITLNSTAESVSTVALRVQFDTGKLALLNASLGAVPVAAGKSLSYNVADNALTALVVGGDAVIGNGVLITLLIRVNPATTPGLPIALSDLGSDAASPDAVLFDAPLSGATLTPTAAGGQYSADADGNWTISLSEVLRVIQFYNLNGLHCQAGTEDGYAPGPGSTACAPHSTDYAPQNWQISLSELLRAIQLFNLSGGVYHTAAGSEDGFAPGPF
jgi:hypothetical protein